MLFRLVVGDFPGIVCILDGDRCGAVELYGAQFGTTDVASGIWTRAGIIEQVVKIERNL